MTKIRVQRNDLFFGNWRFCARFNLTECHALRRLDHDRIDYVIRQRRHWGRKLSGNHGGSWLHAWVPLEITDQDVMSLHDMCEFLQSDVTPRQIMLHCDHMFVYANDLTLFERINAKGLAQLVNVSEAEIIGQPNSILLKKSVWSKRSYLRSRKLNEKIARSMKDFLLVQDSVRLSPSLRSWCEQDRCWVYSHFFIDHHDSAVINMLGFIVPGLVRATRDISAHK